MKILIPTYKQLGNLARKHGDAAALLDHLPTSAGGPAERLRWCRMVLQGHHPSGVRRHVDDRVPWRPLCELYTQWVTEENFDKAA